MNWVPIITTAINAVASIFNDKGKMDAAKNVANQNKIQMEAAADADKLENAKKYQTWIQGAVQTDIEQWALFLNMSPSNVEAVRKAAVAWVVSKGYVLGPLQKGSGYLPAPSMITQYGGKLPGGKLPVNSVSNPPANLVDGGFDSGRGSSSNPLGIPNIDILPDSLKQSGMSPLLILGLIGGAVGVLYQANKGKKSKRRR